MNKLPVAAAVSVVVILFGLPPAIGFVTEARVRERIDDIDAGGMMSANVQSFDRGWFSSTAKIEFGVPPRYLPALAADPTATTRVVVALHFAHGPIAMLDGVHLGWSKMVARLDPEQPGVGELSRQLGIPYLFEFRGRKGFSGAISFDADMPPIDLPVAEARFQFSGAELSGTYAGSHLVASAHADSLDFTSPTGTFAVRNLSARADNELLSQYVMPGAAEFSIERVFIVDALRGQTPVFEGTNLRVASNTQLDEEGAAMQMQVDYTLESLRVEDMEIAAAALGLALRNIDVAAVEAYADAARDPAASDPRAMIETLTPQIDRALRANPSLTLDPMRFRLDGEAFDGRVELSANPARLPPAGTLTLENPLLMLGFVNGSAELRASKPLAQRLAKIAAQIQLGFDPSLPPDQIEYMAEAQAGLTLTLLAGQGVLLEDGGDYRTSIRLDDGALTLNGNSLPFGPL